jgi:hypothetical protein
MVYSGTETQILTQHNSSLSTTQLVNFTNKQNQSSLSKISIHSLKTGTNSTEKSQMMAKSSITPALNISLKDKVLGTGTSLMKDILIHRYRNPLLQNKSLVKELHKLSALVEANH